MQKLASKLIGASIAVAAVAALAPGASALTLNGHSCTDGTVTGTVSCEGAFDGNNSNQDLNGLFGYDWGDEILKAEDSNGFMDSVLDVSGGGNTSGTWDLSGFDFGLYDQLMFVVKGGTTFSAYLWDGTSTSGTWDTLGIVNKSGNTPGISHFSVYGIEGDGSTEDVPEPLATVGLLAIVGGAAALRRRA